MIKTKIMIVEDDAIIFKEMEASLKSMGYKVVASAQTGLEAVEKAEKYQPDVILMDIQLKGKMDGIETAAIIRSRINVSVIYLTAFADDEKLEKAKLTMPLGYLLKPVHNKDLKIAIEIAIYTAKIDGKRRKAEEELAQQKVELQTIFDSVPALVFYKDKNDTFLNVNNRLAESFRLSKKEIIGKTAAELSNIEDKSYFENDLKVINTGKPKTGIIEPLKTHVGVKWVQTDKIPYRNEKGEIIGIVGFSIDITRRKLAEDALKKSEIRFRQLVENLLVGIFIFKNDRIVYQNPECKKIIGDYSNSPLKEFFEIVFNEDRRQIEDSFEKLLSRETQSTNFQFRLFPNLKGENGKAEIWVQSLAGPIRYQDEDAVLVNLLDITKTREMEQYINIQEKMSSLGRISAGIAHEIRNPLTGINTYLYALQNLFDQEDFEDENLKTAKQVVGQIKTASQMIESVIKRVVDFTKTSSPKFILIDANLAVDEAIELSSTSLRKAGINLQVSLAENPLKCFADPLQIKQVVLNLLNNAAKAVENMETDKIIEINTAANSENIIITIADSDTGIKPEIRYKIFEPFFSTRKEGSGIGLSIVQRIVTDHGGTIRLFENQYQGTTFQFELPFTR